MRSNIVTACQISGVYPGLRIVAAIGSLAAGSCRPDRREAGSARNGGPGYAATVSSCGNDQGRMFGAWGEMDEG
jgi:hypothetical protein